MRAQCTNGSALLLLVALLIGGAFATGCLRDDRLDHRPPSGQGSIVVDNRTSHDVNVFINGEQRERVRARRWRAYDMDPGVHRVVLDERHGDRNFRGDVDVLARRLTVVEAAIDPNRFDRFSIFIYFD